jgi:branched-chain amino acid transport system permease protein
MRRFASNHGQLIAYLALTLFIAVGPLLMRGNAYYLSVFILVGIYGIITMGLSLLLGYAGQVSLGHAAFYAMGAYTSAIGTVRYGINPWLCIVLGLVVTALAAYLIGRPTLRLRGHYLAMATLGIGIIVQVFFREGGQFTGGYSGIPRIPRLALGDFTFNTDLKYAYLVWPLVLLVLVLSANLVNSRLGRALRAIHDSEVAARACGVDVSATKVSIFVLSAVCASLAGSLYAHYVTFISFDPFSFQFSVTLVLMVILGGSRSLWGALAGAAIVTVLGQVLTALGYRIPALEGLDVVFFGAMLITAVVFMPAGLAGWLKSVLNRQPKSMEAA